MSSSKLSHREKNPEGYKIDPAELFRVYPKTTKTHANELTSNDWQSGQADAEMPYSAKFEIRLAGVKSLIAEKTAASQISKPTACSFAKTATGSPETGRRSALRAPIDKTATAYDFALRFLSWPLMIRTAEQSHH